MIERETPPPSLVATYHGQPERPAGAFTRVSRLVLRGLEAAMPPAAALLRPASHPVLNAATIGLMTSTQAAASGRRPPRGPARPS